MENAVVIWKYEGWAPQLVRCNKAGSDLVEKVREVKRLHPDAAILVASTDYSGQIDIECASTILAIDDAKQRFLKSHLDA